ncbi:MAG: TlpA family protein disulfide reductase, partial [Bacteroidales bacterium]|nr:TlpA family protein disulfide reductase [Bacteroidales bacterium]
LSVGKKAPEFVITDINGTELNLKDIKSDYTLLLFWASWCSHCADALPKIHDIFTGTERKDLEILAISLDTEKEEWVNAVELLDFTWTNCSELKGWDSKVAIDYNVYATPTMFLLDKKKNILAKPITFNELNAALKKEKIVE